MKELLEYLARALVDKPEAVDVSVTESSQAVVLELRVDSADLGQVIGKQGRIIRALRTVVKAASIKEGKRAIVEIVEQ